MESERTNDLPGEGVQQPDEPTEEPRAEGLVFGPPLQPEPRGQGGGRGLQMRRVLVGAAVAFVVMALLYGPTMAMGAIALAVICTAGLSLLLIIPGCWLVGWVTLAAWEAIGRRWAARAP